MPRPLTAANDTTNPPAAPTLTADMLAAIAARVSAQWDDADSTRHERERDLLGERLYNLDSEASFAEAEGPAGILLQLGVARAQLNWLDGNFVMGEQDGVAHVLALERLLIRVTQWVERTSGLTREAAGLASYYGGENADGYAFGEYEPLAASI